MKEPTLQPNQTDKWSFNPVWIIPLLAIFVAGWMLYQDWSSRGPTVTIVTNNADGIEAGKTKVKVHNVDVGEVSQVKLSNDFEHALITIEMEKGTEKLLRQDTKFWVIKPRVGTEGISGLGTLLSGSYIEVEPGSKGDTPSRYTMLKQPPLSTEEDQGLRLKLVSKDIPKMSAGTPIHFHGFDVGHIESVDFDTQNQRITYRIFIRAPFNSLVNSSVQFWVTPGLAIQSSSKGLAVKMDSLETLITGGISFGVTANEDNGHAVSDMTQFTLYSSKEQATDNRYTQFINYMFLFDGNIGGLEVGAPVEFRGIRIGTVIQVPYHGLGFSEWNKTLHNPSIPVLARFEPQRLTGISGDDDMTIDDWKAMFKSQVELGIRASLSTSNLLTGSKIISVDYVVDPKPYTLTKVAGYPVFPTVPNGLASIGQKVSALLDKLNSLPLDKTVSSLNSTLTSADNTLKTLNKATKQLDELLASDSTKALPDDLVSTLRELERTLQDYQEEGSIGGKINNNLATLERTLNELQPVIRQLQQKPNSLIFDTSNAPDTIPSKGAK